MAVDTLGSESFLVYNAQQVQDKQVYDAVYDYLLNFDPATQEFGPGLATSWKITPDGLKWTMQLRNDVKFSDGTDLTAADVRFLLKKLAEPTSGQPFVKIWIDSLGDVKETGKYEVEVSFRKLFASFAQEISDARGFPIMSESHYRKVGDSGYENNPLGSGAYVLESRTSGIAYRYRSIQRHWRIGTPGFKQLVVQKMPEAVTRVAALRTGEVDAVLIPVGLSKQVGALSNIRLARVPGGYSAGFYLGGLFSSQHPKYDSSSPFLKLNVRKALNLAIDRREIADTILAGQARPGTIHPYLVPGWQDLAPYPFSVDQARALLNEEGYRNGFEVTAWSFATQPENPDLIAAACGYWERINVTCRIRPIDLAAFLSRWRAYDVVNAVFIYGVAPRPDYESGMVATFAEGALTPVFWDKDIATLVASLGNEPDPARRAQVFRRIGQLQYEKYLSVPLVVVDSLIAVGPKVSRGWQPLQRGNVVAGWETLVPN